MCPIKAASLPFLNENGNKQRFGAYTVYTMFVDLYESPLAFTSLAIH